MPGFDGIGANEFIVDVTHPDTVDFISSVDTPYVWELNIWYHTLNVGFRTRIGGETDFPCIYDARVGIGRTYAKLDGALELHSVAASVARRPELRLRRQDSPHGFPRQRPGCGIAGSELRLPAAGNVP